MFTNPYTDRDDRDLWQEDRNEQWARFAEPTNAEVLLVAREREEHALDLLATRHNVFSAVPPSDSPQIVVSREDYRKLFGNHDWSEAVAVLYGVEIVFQGDQ